MKRGFEKVKQSIGMGRKVPTSNLRTDAMEKECRRFAQELKALHKTITDMDAAVTGGLDNYFHIMRAAIPRAYDEPEVGQLTPTDPYDRPLGAHVNTEVFRPATQEMHHRLHNEVLVPISHWLLEYRATKRNSRLLENIRLDLDKYRSTAIGLNEKYQKQRATSHKDADATLFKLNAEEDKLTRMAHYYAEREADVFNSWSRLIADSVLLRDHAAKAIFILQECMTKAAGAFDLSTPVPQPLVPEPIVVEPLRMTDSLRHGGSPVRSPVTSPTLAYAPQRILPTASTSPRAAAAAPALPAPEAVPNTASANTSAPTSPTGAAREREYDEAPDIVVRATVVPQAGPLKMGYEGAHAAPNTLPSSGPARASYMPVSAVKGEGLSPSPGAVAGEPMVSPATRATGGLGGTGLAPGSTGGIAPGGTGGTIGGTGMRGEPLPEPRVTYYRGPPAAAGKHAVGGTVDRGTVSPNDSESSDYEDAAYHSFSQSEASQSYMRPGPGGGMTYQPERDNPFNKTALQQAERPMPA